jgi:precorrin-6x reductase
MRKILCLALLASLLPAVMQAQAPKDPPRKPSLVVFVVGMENDQVSNYLTNLIGNNLARTYTIVPRTEAVKKKLQELKEYEDAGHIDDRQLMEWGRQNNVSVLCLVTAAHVYEYMFSAQLTDVKTNTLIGNGEYEIPSLSSEDLKKTASALAAQIQRKKKN